MHGTAFAWVAWIVQNPDCTLPCGCVQTFVDLLHTRGQRWVPILDPCIHIRKGYAAYDSGIQQDVFLKDVSGKPYVGQVLNPQGQQAT